MSAPRSERDYHAILAAAFRHESVGAVEIGSPLYSRLFALCADDIDSGGVTWELLEPYAHLRVGLALPLRYLGSVHRLVLRGHAPKLAAQYPSAGGSPDDGLWDAFVGCVNEHRSAIADELDWGVQTNEVGRSSTLFPALTLVQRLTGLPVSLREIGTSAGLNLRLDRFRYAQSDWSAGDPGSAVAVSDRWGDHTPPSLPLSIVDRAGCDPNPIDPTTPDGAIHLLGFVWPDQIDRRDRTLAAIDIAKRVPAMISRANADSWLTSELQSRTPAATMVVMHSIVWRYIDRDEQNRITALIESHGATATKDAPLAWLSFEPQEPHLEHAAVTLRLWDGESTGEPVLLAECGFHGQWVRWLA